MVEARQVAATVLSFLINQENSCVVANLFSRSTVSEYKLVYWIQMNSVEVTQKSKLGNYYSRSNNTHEISLVPSRTLACTRHTLANSIQFSAATIYTTRTILIVSSCFSTVRGDYEETEAID